MSDEIFILKNIAGILVSGFTMLCCLAAAIGSKSETARWIFGIGARSMMLLIGIRGLMMSFGT